MTTPAKKPRTADKTPRHIGRGGRSLRRPFNRAATQNKDAKKGMAAFFNQIAAATKTAGPVLRLTLADMKAWREWKIILIAVAAPIPGATAAYIAYRIARWRKSQGLPTAALDKLPAFLKKLFDEPAARAPRIRRTKPHLTAAEKKKLRQQQRRDKRLARHLRGTTVIKL